MAITTQVCPICGASSKERKFVKFFCINCYAKQQKIKVPKKITIQECKECGRVKVRKWNETIEDLIPEIASLCKGKFTNIEAYLYPEKGVCEIQLSFDDAKLKKKAILTTKRSLCDKCTKIARGYYESIIQLRGEANAVERMKEKLINALRETFIPKIEESPYGVDIYVGSTEVTQKAIKRFGLKAEISRKLHTVKKGRRLFRTTFLIKV